MFLKLTRLDGNTIFINVYKIEHIVASTMQGGTSIVYINSNKDQWFHVKESMEEIEAMCDLEPVFA